MRQALNGTRAPKDCQIELENEQEGGNSGKALAKPVALLRR
jgi:hypothetical protein